MSRAGKVSGNERGWYSTIPQFNTLIPLSRELWLMIDSVMPSCCSRMTATVELATRYSTPDTNGRDRKYKYDSGLIKCQFCDNRMV